MRGLRLAPFGAALVLLTLTQADLAAGEEDQVERGQYLVRAGGCFSCHTAKGGEAGWRPTAHYPVRDLLQPEHHARSRHRYRPLGRRAILACAARWRPPRWCELFPGVPVSELHRDHRQQCLGNEGVPVLASSSAPAEPAARRSVPNFLALAPNRLELLFFTPGPFQSAPDRSVAYNRGAYLVTALAHCGECHTPRNLLGATQLGQQLAATPDGPDGQLVPNITPDPTTGIGRWDKDDVVELLRTGATPEQSRVKGAMREVIEDGLKYQTKDDLRAIADYHFAQPAIVHEVSQKH